MSTEIHLQIDLFSGDLVDNRSDHQKRLDRERQQPRQQMLFGTHDEVGLRRPARPWLATTPEPVRELEIQDMRTDDEREMDLMREAQELMKPLFESPKPMHALMPNFGSPLISGEPAEYRIPLLYLGKEELAEVRPDLKSDIERLKDTDIEVIAMEAEEALRAVYGMVLNITLTNYLTHNTLNDERPL